MRFVLPKNGFLLAFVGVLLLFVMALFCWHLLGSSRGLIAAVGHFEIGFAVSRYLNEPDVARAVQMLEAGLMLLFHTDQELKESSRIDKF